MRNIRKLYFQNAAGHRWGLNGDRGVYASNLSGFGFTRSPVFADISRGFFIPVSGDNDPQNSLAFTLTFTRSPYETYKQMIDWLAAAGAITIIYNPTGQQEYCRDVTISFMEKGELTKTRWLEAPSSFLCNTPWYLPSPTSLTVEANGSDESKRYNYEYTEDLRYGVDSSTALVSTISGAGHIPGALELSFYGAIVNPTIRLIGNISGKTYGVCNVAVSLGDTDVLKFSTKHENAYIKRVAADGTETDLLDQLELSSNPFFRLPVDEPCDFFVEADAPFTGYAELQIYYYYRSV